MKKYRFILLMTFIGYLGIMSCSKEEELIRIDGTWKVELWEHRGCVIEETDFSYDLTGDGCQGNLHGRELCYQLYYTFDTLNSYLKWLQTDRLVVQQTDTITELGYYELLTNNEMVMCRDTFCDTIGFIRQGNRLDIVFPPDTIKGCGVHYLAKSVN